MFEKILIANRGEIACRIIKTAKKLGIASVVVYSEADKNSQAVQLADESYYIGEAASSESYLKGEKIIEIALKTGAEAIHPGYGFLSENAQFAKACEKAGIVFIGPPASAIEAMGSKSAAKSLMESSQVPVTPGYHGNNQAPDFLLEEAKRIGFPVLLKAAAGGGGKGMRAVFNESEFEAALSGAKREAKASFGDEEMLIEKYLIEPRHVEIQIFCDHHGNAVYLFERDCSIQRRHQKVIEEAPAPHLKPEVREAMGKAAIQAAKSIGYVGAGTIEFLLDKQDNFYFMEMNTRLQVEHPVTEMITQQDLVEWQLRVACNEPLPLKQDELHIHGHAIEVRIYAEDTDNQFLPSTGKLVYFSPPEENPFIRVDTGFTQNDTITPYYDPMMAKLIAWGKDRASAIAHLYQALQNYYVIGVKNNIAFLKKILEQPDFTAGLLSTSFIEKHTTSLHAPDNALETKIHFAAIFAALYKTTEPVKSDDPWQQKDAWQMNLPAKRIFSFKTGHHIKHIFLEKQQDIFVITAEDHPEMTVTAYRREAHQINLKINQEYYSAGIFSESESLHVLTHDGIFSFNDYHPESLYEQDDSSDGQLTAPMPGVIVALHVEVGQMVSAGQPVAVMEAMKMEHTLKAPYDGKIKEIYFPLGAQVNDGEELMAIETE